MAFKFEQLKVWQRSVELSGEVFELTKKFPKEEVYVLSTQIQRASDSIALNIAEGSTGQSNKEFKRFLGIAIRSAIEVVCCFYLAKRRKLVTDHEFSYFYNELSELIRGMQALRKSIKTA
ncbi:MAG: four helix bundle protein [Cyclobacteriaceae bacterium]|nr:four helix bundle protein [Cyclobacteriaceae bacterium]